MNVVITNESCLVQDDDTVCPTINGSAVGIIPTSQSQFKIQTSNDIVYNSIQDSSLSPWISLTDSQNNIIDLGSIVQISGSDLIIPTASLLAIIPDLTQTFTLYVGAQPASPNDGAIQGYLSNIVFGTGQLKIDLADQAASLQVSDGTGRFLFSAPPNSGTQINIPDLPIGYYLITATDGVKIASGSIQVVSGANLYEVQLTPLDLSTTDISSTFTIIPQNLQSLLVKSTKLKAQTTAQISPPTIKGQNHTIPNVIPYSKTQLAKLNSSSSPQVKAQTLVSANDTTAPGWYTNYCGANPPFPVKSIVQGHLSEVGINWHLVANGGGFQNSEWASDFQNVPPNVGRQLRFHCSLQSPSIDLPWATWYSQSSKACCPSDPNNPSVHKNCVDNLDDFLLSVNQSIHDSQPISLIVQLRDGVQPANSVSQQLITSFSTLELNDHLTGDGLQTYDGIPLNGNVPDWGLPSEFLVNIPATYAQPQLKVSLAESLGPNPTYNYFCDFADPEPSANPILTVSAIGNPTTNGPIISNSTESGNRSLASSLNHLFPLEIDTDPLAAAFPTSGYVARYRAKIQSSSFVLDHFEPTITYNGESLYLGPIYPVGGGSSAVADFEIPISILSEQFSPASGVQNVEIDIKAVGTDPTLGSGISSNIVQLVFTASFDVLEEGDLEYSNSVIPFGTTNLVDFVNTVRGLASTVGILYSNDGSLPFGGYFFPHKGHDMGVNLDVRYFEQNPNDYDGANAAKKIQSVASYLNYSTAPASLSPSERIGCKAIPQVQPSIGTCPVVPIDAMTQFSNYITTNRNSLDQIAVAYPKLKDIHMGKGVGSNASSIALCSANFPTQFINNPWHQRAFLEGTWPDGSPILTNGNTGDPIGKWQPKGPVDFNEHTCSHLDHVHFEVKSN